MLNYARSPTETALFERSEGLNSTQETTWEHIRACLVGQVNFQNFSLSSLNSSQQATQDQFSEGSRGLKLDAFLIKLSLCLLVVQPVNK